MVRRRGSYEGKGFRWQIHVHRTQSCKLHFLINTKNQCLILPCSSYWLSFPSRSLSILRFLQDLVVRHYQKVFILWIYPAMRRQAYFHITRLMYEFTFNIILRYWYDLKCSWINYVRHDLVTSGTWSWAEDCGHLHLADIRLFKNRRLWL